jgi:hypothetical protein
MFPVVIVLTDGANGYVPTFSQYLPMARGTGVPIYTVGLGAGVIDRELYDIAEVSNGGKYFFANDAEVLNETFARIAADIGAGTSRALGGEEVSSTGSRAEFTGPDILGSFDDLSDALDTEGRDSSRLVRTLHLVNPVGGEKWGVGTYRNVSWACRADTQANCARALVQVSIDGGGWTTVANNIGTRLDFPTFQERNWYHVGTGWYPRDTNPPLGPWIYTYNFNWTVPDVESNNVRLRVCITDGGRQTCASSSAFEIFDMGVLLGGGGADETYYLTTEEFRLDNYEKSTLKFWQRYDLLYTENGGIVMVGNAANPAGPYQYAYAQPTQPYSGNIRLDKTVTDDYGTEIKWAWNGRSGGGTYDWEYIQLDLTPYIDPARPWVKVKFMFYTWGFGNGGSWWIDDVRITVQRSDTVAITPTMADQWEYYEWTGGVDPAAMEPHSGTHMWWNHNPAASHDLNSGVDNSLYSKSIDLTNAKDAYLSAYFKFNFDDSAGRPPDGFRTEISDDNGITWRPVNLGVRSSWGVSGDWNTDGKSPDGTQAYTGIQEGGLDSDVPVWVEAGTLWRLNTNLSGWAGSVIKLRFRVVTNLDATHYDAATEFRGFAVDDVIVRGNTTISSAPMYPGEMDPTEDPSSIGDPFLERDPAETEKVAQSLIQGIEADI